MTHSSETKKPVPSEAASESMLRLLTRMDKLRDEAIARRLENERKPAPPWSPDVYVPALVRARERFESIEAALDAATGAASPVTTDALGQVNAAAKNPASVSGPVAAIERLVADFCAPVVDLLRESMQLRRFEVARNSRGSAGPSPAQAAKRPLDLVCWEPDSRLLYLEWARDIDTTELARSGRVTAAIEAPSGRRTVAAAFARRYGGAWDPLSVTIELSDDDSKLIESGDVDVMWFASDDGQGDRLEVVFRVGGGRE